MKRTQSATQSATQSTTTTVNETSLKKIGKKEKKKSASFSLIQKAKHQEINSVIQTFTAEELRECLQSAELSRRVGWSNYFAIKEELEKTKLILNDIKTKVELKEKSDEKCTVCRENIKIKDMSLTECCGHPLHKHCLVFWNEISTTCPFCKK